MWTIGTTHIIARLTGSTLFTNYNLQSIVANDHRSFSTTNENTPSLDHASLVAKLRDLRAYSPYTLFVKDNYSQIRQKNPELKMGDISKKIALAWKNLSEEKRQAYSKLYHDRKLAYEQEKSRLSHTDLRSVVADATSKKLLRQFKDINSQLPKSRPRSAFMHFVGTLERGNSDIGDFMRGAAQQWAKLAEQDKQKFNDLYDNEKQKYLLDIASWLELQNKEIKVQRRSRSTAAVVPKIKDKVEEKQSEKTAAKSASKSPSKRSTKEKTDKDRSSSSSSDRSTSRKVKNQ